MKTNRKITSHKSRNQLCNDTLDVNKVLGEFQKAEHSTAHRMGTFKIEGTFEDALKTILKSKPEPKPPKPSTK